MEEKQNEQQEEEQFINKDLFRQAGEYDEENKQINMPQINNIGTNYNINNEMSVKKKKSKKTDKLSTTIDTAHKDIIIQKTSLLDLENNGMSLSEYVFKKEEEIQQKEGNEKKEIKEEENNENLNENSQEPVKNDADDDSDSLKDIKVIEEDEETKKKRELVIEKMSKKYDEIVDIPGYNILNEEICKEFEKENDQ